MVFTILTNSTLETEYVQVENNVIPLMEKIQIPITISEPDTMQIQEVETTINNIYIQENNFFILEVENMQVENNVFPAVVANIQFQTTISEPDVMQVQDVVTTEKKSHVCSLTKQEKIKQRKWKDLTKDTEKRSILYILHVSVQKCVKTRFHNLAESQLTPSFWKWHGWRGGYMFWTAVYENR